jgi:DNA-binding NtrC family response regulator
VAATNRDPESAVQSGNLREDLFYRLNVFPIALPPLRSRPEDIDLLAEHFLGELNRVAGSTKRWTSGAVQRLRENSWTGNVRELRNAIHRAFILGGEEIGPEVVPAATAVRPDAACGPIIEMKVGSSIAEVEERIILATLEFTGGDKRRAAEILGISLKTLYNRLNVYTARGAFPAKGNNAVSSSPRSAGIEDLTM